MKEGERRRKASRKRWLTDGLGSRWRTYRLRKRPREGEEEIRGSEEEQEGGKGKAMCAVLKRERGVGRGEKKEGREESRRREGEAGEETGEQEERRE